MKDHIPEFNFDNIPIHITDPREFVNAVVNERKRVCGPIFERIYQLTDEFYEKVTEIKKLRKSLETTKGFFKKLKIYSQICEIENVLR